MDDSIALMDNEEKEFDLEFHGIRYLITIRCKSSSNSSSLLSSSTNVSSSTTINGSNAMMSMLSIEAEQYDTNDRWSAEYTSQYVEEITHKAGNFKKFNVFLRMLIGAFYKDKESVFVDLLTYSDLEILKARKLGQSTSSNASIASSTNGGSNRQQMKRYVILTYSGEYDRVHYPLPLQFEEVPNPDALKRTIIRLRRRAEEKDVHNLQSNDKEKEMKSIIAQLRQENTELKHRLRQLESRATKATLAANSMNPNSSVSGPGSGGSATLGSNVGPGANAALAAAAVQSNQELLTANARLKKQVETLRAELDKASANYEKLRIESAREINRWKLKIGGSEEASSASMGFGVGALGERTMPSGNLVEMQRRVEYLEKQLRAERAKAAGKALRAPTPPTRASHSASGSSGAARRSSSAELRARMTNGNNSAPSNTRSRGTPATAQTSSRYSSGVGSFRSGSDGRSMTPPPRTTNSANARTRPSRSPSPAENGSSRRRFDPTAYQQEREKKLQRGRRANDRYGHESGYSSASSAGSSRQSSRHSTRSNSSQNSREKVATRKKKTSRTVSSRSSSRASTRSNDVTRSSHLESTGQNPMRGSALQRSSFGVAMRERDLQAENDDLLREMDEIIGPEKKKSTKKVSKKSVKKTSDPMRRSATGNILSPDDSILNSSNSKAHTSAGIASASFSRRDHNTTSAVSSSAAQTSSEAALATLASRIEAVSGRVSASLEDIDSSTPVVVTKSMLSRGVRSSHDSLRSEAESNVNDSLKPSTSTLHNPQYSDSVRSSFESTVSGTGARSAGQSSSGIADIHYSRGQSNTTGIARSVDSQSSHNVPNSPSRVSDDISDIDKRILALQSYLDNARTGILSSFSATSGVEK